MESFAEWFTRFAEKYCRLDGICYRDACMGRYGDD